MPHQTEPNVNNALGGLLRGMLYGADVRSEHTQVIECTPGLRPDILITERGRSAVVVEAEYEPARNVEDEARDRLGLEVVEGGRKVEAVIALQYPDEVANCADLRAALCNTRLSYCVFTDDPRDPDRFPESGWLHGSVSDLADLIRLVSVPQRAVDTATDAMQRGIEGAAALLDEMDKARPGITMSIARLLGMSNVPQTRRMACAIVANTMVFHERIAGMHTPVKPLVDICGNGAANPQWDIMATWQHILSINYWPIFDIARKIIGQLTSGDAAQLLRRLYYTTGELNAAGVDNAHDLTGRVFQRLISDRKYLATFYTRPASASLLARLAVAKMGDVDWSDADAIGSLRIGDFACGTGALLSAVYEQVASRHERVGGDPSALHPVMMEEVLYGLDVMPSAVHITGATLSGAYPSVSFDKSRIYPLPYGRQQRDNSVLIGSLELLQSSSVLALFNTADPAMRVGSTGEDPVEEIRVDIPDEGYDLVIMNPPFTRNTTHEGAYADTITAAFAAFGASEADQREMASRMAMLKEGTCYHGNAGMASAFAALADKKLKPGGVLALVLPLSATGGLAWQAFRRMLANDYADLTVATIAAARTDTSFSSDTSIAECLVVARKAADGEAPNLMGKFVSLRSRPPHLVHSSEIAKNIGASDDCIRQIEDGPYGGEPLRVGSDLMGELIGAPLDAKGGAWGAVRLSDYSVAQTAYALSRSKLWLPAMPAQEIEMAALGAIGNLGLYHLDIIGRPPRGPFSKDAPSPTATYPALWNHNAQRETRMVCEPDSQLRVRRGMEAKADRVWATRSRAHMTMDFGFGSQPLAAAFTEVESMGGSAWPNVQFNDESLDYPFTVWNNSTLGLLLFWWHSNLQQGGRGRITVSSAESLPVLDLRALTDEQLTTAKSIFDEFRDKELKPAYLADADPNRALLDRRVVCDLLGFDDGVYEGVRRLAAKWCAEPSVHGGKARPRGAELVV